MSSSSFRRGAELLLPFKIIVNEILTRPHAETSGLRLSLQLGWRAGKTCPEIFDRPSASAGADTLKKHPGRGRMALGCCNFVLQ